MSVNHLLAAGLVLTVVALGAGACADEGAPAPESSSEPVPEGYDPLDEPSMPKERRRVDGESTRTDEEVAGRRTRVTRVIDGDTVEAAKLGRVRLIGVDAPEEGSATRL